MNALDVSAAMSETDLDPIRSNFFDSGVDKYGC
jgi:hypothetical protein